MSDDHLLGDWAFFTQTLFITVLSRVQPTHEVVRSPLTRTGKELIRHAVSGKVDHSLTTVDCCLSTPPSL